jgi:hypothetical protein
MAPFWRGFYVGLQKMGAIIVTPLSWREEWKRINGNECGVFTFPRDVTITYDRRRSMLISVDVYEHKDRAVWDRLTQEPTHDD